MLRKSKMEILKEQMEEAQAKLRANMLQRDALSQELRELCAEEKQPFVPEARLLAISRRKAAILAEEAQLRDKERELGAKANQAKVAYNDAQRRLREAERVVNVIANPPAWGLGDYSPHQIEAFKQQAQKTIKELG